MNLSPGYSKNRIVNRRRSRGPRKNYNSRIKPQTKPSGVTCPFCWRTVAPHEEQRETSEGIAHYTCAVDRAIERLESVKLLCPTVYKNFQDYLTEQAKILLWGSSEDAEYKFAEILDISDELLGNPIQLPTLLMVEQSQGISP